MRPHAMRLWLCLLLTVTIGCGDDADETAAIAEPPCADPVADIEPGLETIAAADQLDQPEPEVFDAVPAVPAPQPAAVELPRAVEPPPAAPQPKPPEAENETPGSRLEEQVEQALDLLAVGDETSYRKAVAQLRALGRCAEPVLVRFLRRPDPAVRRRIARALSDLAGTPSSGQPIDGLRLSVLQVGLPPNRNVAIPVWLRFTNVAAHPIAIREIYCDLFAAPREADASAIYRQMKKMEIGWRNRYELLEDYYRIAPGESLDYLADVDVLPEHSGRTAIQIVARPCVRSPDRVGNLSWPLLRVPFDVRFHDGEQEHPDDAALRQSHLYEPLRLPNESDRWHAFMQIRDNPAAKYEDAFIDFWARWGPRNPKGGTPGTKTRTFAEGLPGERRYPFLERAAHAYRYCWRDQYMTAQEYHDHAKDMRELSYAAWLFKLLRADGHTFETFDEEQGWPDGVPVRRFVAWQYAMSRDARVRNTDEAVAIARKLQDDDESLATRFVCATVLGQDEKRRELDRQMTRDDAPRADLSLIVWYLATAAEASAADRELATELAMQLIASSADTEQRTRAQDLLAATYAARGMFGQAIENQRRLPLPAVKDQGRRRAMRARMALYKGLAAAPAGDWFDLDSLRNPASRDALLQLMREAPDPDLRKEAEDLLRITFGADMGAESVPEPLSQPPTQVF